MSITLRPPVRPEGAELDQATGTFVLVALAAAAPALLVRMLASVGAASSSAPGARAMWSAVAALVRMLGLGGLALLGMACAAAAVAAMRPGPDDVQGDSRIAALYAAAVVVAAAGLALLA